jgi:hypothetical protein
MTRIEPGFKGAKLVGAVVDTAANPGLGSNAKTYVVGANAAKYNVPTDASVVLFVDEQGAMIRTCGWFSARRREWAHLPGNDLKFHQL